ncbi:putative Pro-resilin-like 182, partial [Homarus americanus]
YDVTAQKVEPGVYKLDASLREHQFDSSSITNMYFKALVLVAVVVATLARPDSPPTYNAPTAGYGAPSPVAPAQYDFNWAVQDDLSGNDFGHQES